MKALMFAKLEPSFFHWTMGKGPYAPWCTILEPSHHTRRPRNFREGEIIPSNSSIRSTNHREERKRAKTHMGHMNDYNRRLRSSFCINLSKDMTRL